MSEQTGDQTGPAGGRTGRMPADTEPGGESTPLDTEGAGPVGLQDRTRTDEKGSPATNQGKAEPIPPTPGHRDPQAPLTPPLLEDMNVGATDPQVPSHPAAADAPTTGAEPRVADGPANAPRDLSGPGEPAFETRPTVDGTSSTGRDRGVEVPASSTPGRSHRAPGLMGEDSPAEQVETDVEDSAAAMVRDTGRDSGSGDVHAVPVPSETPSPGTSEEHGVVQGARIPRSD